MIKWFVYIVFLLAFAPCLLFAKANSSKAGNAIALHGNGGIGRYKYVALADTTKNKSQTKPDAKVKEVPKPRKQSKPEKVDEADAKGKPKRERRPDGMQRPPEIPRRNDN